MTLSAGTAISGTQGRAGTILDAFATLGDKHSRLLEPAAAKLLATRRPAKSTGLLVVPRAAIVAQVVPSRPAEPAGLALGDRIVAVEGVPGFADLPHFEFGRLFRIGQRPPAALSNPAKTRRLRWADARSARVFAVDFRTCPRCGGARRRIARTSDGLVVRRIPGAPRAAGFAAADRSR